MRSNKKWDFYYDSTLGWVIRNNIEKEEIRIETSKLTKKEKASLRWWLVKVLEGVI